MPLSHVLGNLLINHIRSNYASVWVGAYTALPTKTGGGTEAIGGSYARVEMDTDVIFTAAALSLTDSDAQVAFATFTASPGGAVVAWGLFDAAAAGNMLAWYPLATPLTIGNGDNVAFPIGNLIIRNI